MTVNHYLAHRRICEASFRVLLLGTTVWIKTAGPEAGFGQRRRESGSRPAQQSKGA